MIIRVSLTNVTLEDDSPKILKHIRFLGLVFSIIFHNFPFFFTYVFLHIFYNIFFDKYFLFVLESDLKELFIILCLYDFLTAKFKNGFSSLC